VGFDVSTLATSRIFQSTVKSIEGVADRDIDVLVRLAGRRRPIYDDVATRHLEIDTDAVETAFGAVSVRCANDDTAGRDAGMEFGELYGSLDDAGTNRFRGRPGRCRRRTVTWCRRATTSSSSEARLRTRNESREPRADRSVSMPMTV